MGVEVKIYPTAEETIYSNKEIAKRLRSFVKATYPRTKFSIKVQGGTIAVRIVSSKDQIILPEFTKEYLYTYDGLQINPYGRTSSKFLTEHAKDILEHIVNYGNQWNWDRSDAMTDYFDVNFYWGLRVGDGTDKLVSESTTPPPPTKETDPPDSEMDNILAVSKINTVIKPLRCQLDDQIKDTQFVWQFIIDNEDELKDFAENNIHTSTCAIIDALNLLADYELCVDKSDYKPSKKLAAMTSIQQKLDKLKTCN